MSTPAARQRAHMKRYLRVQAAGLCHRCEERPRVTSKLCRPCQDRVSGLARQRYRKDTSSYGYAFTQSLIQQGIAWSQRGIR